MATATFTKTGTKATTAVTLNKAVFGEEVTSTQLLKTAYEVQQGNRRLGNAKTKLRGEVRGGGKKPWKQKGTGRARVGSIRSPLWRGGGITFGPNGEQNYTRKISTAAKQKAIRQALSLKSKAGVVSVIEAFENKDAKTAATAALIARLELKGRILLVVANKDENVVRATNNLQSIKVLEAKYVNVVDAIDADSILIEKAALETLDAWLGGTK